MAKEYLGITGDPEFTKLAAELAYGPNCAPLKEGFISTTQAISGTGALRVGMYFVQIFRKLIDIGGVFLARFFEGAGGKKIYVPTPTWGNHIPIFKDSGLEVVHYRYFDKKTNGLDFAGMVEDLKVITLSLKHTDSVLFRKFQTSRLYYFMLVPTILLE